MNTDELGYFIYMAGVEKWHCETCQRKETCPAAQRGNSCPNWENRSRE